MLHTALYSNDSDFLNDFSKELEAQLRAFSQRTCRFYKYSLFQTSLFAKSDVPPDVCIVDIRDDPERDMQFARELPRSANTEIMIIAPNENYAMQAYDADFMSYMVYPPDVSRAAKILLRRFTQRLHSQENQFSFKTASGVRFLSAERIVYVEYSDHRLIIYTDLGKKLVTTTMRLSFGEAAAHLLADSRFVRTHASFIVNILHISEFGQSVLVMDNGVSVPVSHSKRREVKQHFTEFFR